MTFTPSTSVFVAITLIIIFLNSGGHQKLFNGMKLIPKGSNRVHDHITAWHCLDHRSISLGVAALRVLRSTTSLSTTQVYLSNAHFLFLQWP